MSKFINNQISICQLRNETPKKGIILNDPVYGFITIPFPIIFKLFNHPMFQRLRRIKQLGLTHYVYPGAVNTRFHHALGALYLMTEAVEVLRFKGHEITDEEFEAVCIGILLHDIGHGPYSHTLENHLIIDVNHEFLSALIMEKLNEEFNGKLDLAITIFNNKYQKPFLNQLITSQLDVDRLDYLKRDSFYTGVYEGVISTERIIKLMQVKNGQLVVEAKAIYSIEKFLIARRLMYWQVYLHKTVVCAEETLVKILKRARELANNGEELFCTPALKYFLYNKIGTKDFINKPETLENFSALDDYDVLTSVKLWTKHSDTILSVLCISLINRKLLKVEYSTEPFKNEVVEVLKQKAADYYKVSMDLTNYIVFTGHTKNELYDIKAEGINLLYKNGELKDFASVSDELNINVLSGPVTKYYLCYPKDLIILPVETR